MNVHPAFQFFGVGILALMLGGILLAFAIEADTRGAMTLQRPALALIGFGGAVVGGCCLLAGAALGISSAFVTRKKKDNHNEPGAAA